MLQRANRFYLAAFPVWQTCLVFFCRGQGDQMGRSMDEMTMNSWSPCPYNWVMMDE
jgi:hypothetical protein